MTTRGSPIRDTAVRLEFRTCWLRPLFSFLQVRSQVAYGSVGEVERFEKLVGVKAMAALEEA